MSRPDSADKDQLVDQLADQFETAWRAGERPKIESFLESAQASSRPRLLAELIKLEFELRQQAGEMPQVDEYRRRFPSLIAEVEEFFSQVDSSIMATTTIVAGTTPARGQLLIRLNCPHCQNPIQVVEDESVEDLLCPSCGSSFKLDHDRTQSWKPEKLPRLGRYQLLEAVGRGAFGTVYRAQDTELSRIVAIKVPRTGQLVTRDEEDRFVREARSVAQLHHSSIVPVYEIGRSDSFPYIVSRFVDGVTLADSITAKDWEPRAAAELIAAVAEALECAHQQGVIHRDVKPSNIMIDQQGHSYLMDFGLARRDAGEVTVTTDGQVLGTPAYMSPEQARGEAHRVDGRSDVYSLGVILYQLLVGELPFRGNTRMLLQQVLHDEPRAPRSRKPSVPRDLDTICLKAMAKEPQQRYQSASEMAADLRRYLAGEPILARRSGLLVRGWRLAKRHKVSVAMVALLIGWMGTVTAAFVMRQNNTSHLNLTAEQSRSDNKTHERQAENVAEQIAVLKWSGRQQLELGDAPTKHDVILQIKARSLMQGRGRAWIGLAYDPVLTVVDDEHLQHGPLDLEGEPTFTFESGQHERHFHLSVLADPSRVRDARKATAKLAITAICKDETGHGNEEEFLISYDLTRSPGAVNPPVAPSDGVPVAQPGNSAESVGISDPIGPSTLIEFRPPPHVPPEILVLRATQKRGELMFIFDCSGSMSEATANGTRFDVARNTLFGIDENGGVLDRLAGAGAYRVGLRIYGHRVGLDPRNPQQTRRNPAILKLLPQLVNSARYKQELDRIRLGNDVDRLLRICHFTDVELREIRKLFYSEGLKPWGITPLYYSIAQALAQDFGLGTNASDRRIVVLTDGNDQQNLDRELSAKDRMDAATLRALFKDYNQKHRGQEVKLEIVGFQIEEALLLQEIAKETGGKYYSATSPNQLLDSLEQSLSLSNYVVVSPDGNEIGPGDFGKPLPINPPPRQRAVYRVRLNNNSGEANVELEGGEAIELDLTDIGELVHKRYQRELRNAAKEILNPNPAIGPREVYLGSHQPPARVGEERRFIISVQNQNETQFSPRPAEVWAEIMPIKQSSGELAPTFTFFDAYFEPLRPVPVLVFEVPRWPADASEAKVMFWCKYTRTQPDDEVHVADVANQANPPQQKRTIGNLIGATFDINVAPIGDPLEEVSEVIVTVKQTGTDRGPIKVEMFPPPAAIQHQYFASDLTARHRFQYEGVSQKELLNKISRDYSVCFTSAENLKKGAIVSPEPMRVNIPQD